MCFAAPEVTALALGSPGLFAWQKVRQNHGEQDLRLKEKLGRQSGQAEVCIKLNMRQDSQRALL